MTLRDHTDAARDRARTAARADVAAALAALALLEHDDPDGDLPADDAGGPLEAGHYPQPAALAYAAWCLEDARRWAIGSPVWTRRLEAAAAFVTECRRLG